MTALPPGAAEPRDDAHPGPRRRTPRPSRGRPRVLQGELAAGEDAGHRAARLRPGPEQRLLQRRPRRHARHPHRAVGQVHLAGDRPDLRRLGRHARGRDLRHDLHPRDGHLGGGLRAPRGRQQLPGARGLDRLHLPRQRPLAPGRDLPRARAGRPDGGDRLADPAVRGDHQREGPAAARARPEHGDGAQEDAHRRGARPARPRPARRPPGCGPRRPVRRRGRHGARPDRRRGRRRLAVARVRRRAQRRGLHRRRRRRDHRGAGGRVGRQRHRSGHTGADSRASTASPSCTTPRSTSSTARQPSTPATPRTSRSPRSASTPSPRPPATSPWAWPRATTCSARPG